MAASIMTMGLELHFLSPPPLTFVPPARAMPGATQLPLIRPFIPVLLSRHIIRKIATPQLLYFSRVFVVGKKNNSSRLVIDLSLLNLLLIVPRFKMETVEKIALNITGPMWGCTIDMEDAFFHVPVGWDYQRYLAFVVDGQIYVFQFLPFGLASAPWAFSRVIKPIKSFLHRLMVRIHSFLDDSLLHPSQEGLVETTSLVLALFRKLGFSINLPKSNLSPSQRVVYLGVLFHLDTLQLSLPEEKILSISSLCRDMAQSSSRFRRQMESLLGLLSWASFLVPLGRLRLLPLLKWMNVNSSPATRDLHVPLHPSFTSLLVGWQDLSFLGTPVPMSIPTPSLQLMTDASLSGWSGVLLPLRVSGGWPLAYGTHSINWLELKAIFNSIQHFLPLLRNCSVLIMSDNSTAVSCIRRQGSLRSDHLLSLTSSLLEFCLLHSITLVPKHLSGALNVLADQGSRSSPVSTEWSLDPQTFRWISSLAGPFQVDLFATRDNRQLRSFVSPFPDPLACGTNALSLHWDQWDSVYLFPPIPLLTEVVARLCKFVGRGALVAPLYPQSGWFPNLLRRSKGQFPLPPHSLSQLTLGGRTFHSLPSVYRLHVWIL